MRSEIDGDPAQVLFIDAGGAGDDLLGVVPDQLDVGFRTCSAADQERRPRMPYPKCHGRERALRSIAVQLVAADPVIALVLAFHVAAPPGDRVALDRLAAKCLALGRPVLERARLEIEVERFAVRSD